MSTATETPTDGVATAPAFAPGVWIAAVVLCIYGGLALTVDFPRTALGIQSDEATYYMLGHSIAEDGDVTYRREDLVRVWREFPSGPTGLFLKRGTDILEFGLMRRFPFVWARTQPDPDQSRLFYGKSFIYPLAAAPFVRVFGTNGFLVFHAILLALVVWCAYCFLHATMRPAVAATLAAGFVFATVVPVYAVWIAPELFNFSLGVFAYFCWLYKEVAPPIHLGRRSRWLATAASDAAAAALLGLATYSKISNALLFPPIVIWQLWRRQWRRAMTSALVFTVVAGGLFAINIASSGEWNYQGGERRTFYWEFPYQTPTSGFEVGTEKARDEALTDIIFDRTVFWSNLRHNLVWYFFGRYSGLIAYFFPAVFALGGLALAWRRTPGWQLLVLGAGIAQLFLFIIMTPYTWMGGGGSVGNRYFLGAYGVYLFLLPQIRSSLVAAVPWMVGGLFMGKLILNPFATSFYPGRYADSGPLRLLPVELSNVNDLPINTDSSRVRVWFGDNEGQKDPGFQIYFLDDKAYGREADKSFWVKGSARAQFMIKTDRPMKQLLLTLTAGPVPTHVVASLSGRTQEVSLEPGASQQILFAMSPGFRYQGHWPVWVASVSSSNGFVPIFEGDTRDTRYLGVRVKPTLVE